jgi:hypothetical protein
MVRDFGENWKTQIFALRFIMRGSDFTKIHHFDQNSEPKQEHNYVTDYFLLQNAEVKL